MPKRSSFRISIKSGERHYSRIWMHECPAILWLFLYGFIFGFFFFFKLNRLIIIFAKAISFLFISKIESVVYNVSFIQKSHTHTFTHILNPKIVFLSRFFFPENLEEICVFRKFAPQLNGKIMHGMRLAGVLNAYFNCFFYIVFDLIVLFCTESQTGGPFRLQVMCVNGAAQYCCT